MRVGWVRIGDFRPISRRISETVRDTTKVTINNIRKSYTRFRLVPKSTTLVDPEMTLDGNYALCCIHTCVSEQTTKICMKIDPYYQRQKKEAQGS